MQTYDLTESEAQLLTILRKLKPFQRVEIMADGEGRPDTYILTESSKRMILAGKQVFIQLKTQY
jgi:hypothetical protein